MAFCFSSISTIDWESRYKIIFSSILFRWISTLGSFFTSSCLHTRRCSRNYWTCSSSWYPYHSWIWYTWSRSSIGSCFPQYVRFGFLLSLFNRIVFWSFQLDLITDCYDGDIPRRAIYGVHAEREILNPINKEVYEFMEKLLEEVAVVFKNEPYIHLGMDEVYPACWYECNQPIKFNQ